MRRKASAENVVRNIRGKRPRRHSTEEKIWIVLEGLRGEENHYLHRTAAREGILNHGADSRAIDPPTRSGQRRSMGSRL